MIISGEWWRDLATCIWNIVAFQCCVSFCVCMLSCFSHVRLFVTRWTAALQDSLSMGFQARILEWVAMLLPEMEPTSLTSPALAGRYFTCSATWEAHIRSHCITKWISYMHTYIPLLLDSLPILVTAEPWAELPELCSSFSLVIYLYIVSIVYICQAQSPNSSHPLLSPLASTSVSLGQLCVIMIVHSRLGTFDFSLFLSFYMKWNRGTRA